MRTITQNTIIEKVSLNTRKQSLRGLDIVNVFMADVKDGVGVDLSVYLLASVLVAVSCMIVVAGFTVSLFGYTTGFYTLASIGVFGTFFFWKYVKETAVISS